MKSSHEKLLIRPATKDDIGVIIAIARQTWPVAYKDILSPRALNYMLDHFYSPAALASQMDKGQQFFIAQLAGEYPGFASLGDLQNGTWKLYKLYVLPQYQKTGAGAALMLHAIDFVRAH
ncbi:MAG TPA: GNAT family N-acetyltransferase, partial [Chitinophagaceae bacterium]